MGNPFRLTSDQVAGLGGDAKQAYLAAIAEDEDEDEADREPTLPEDALEPRDAEALHALRGPLDAANEMEQARTPEPTGVVASPSPEPDYAPEIDVVIAKHPFLGRTAVWFILWMGNEIRKVGGR